MAGPFYFAWIEPDEEFDPEIHNRFDERVLSISISHDEGNIPALTISLKNPRVGLLSAGRNMWCWLSRDKGGGVIIPEFKGRLIGVPSDLHREAVTLEFIARPLDFVEQKQALADSLRSLPWWDDVWVDEEKATPESVLETRSVLFHLDRIDLTVSVSDILQGEDDDITVENHLYQSLSVSYGQTPLRRVDVIAEVEWDQIGKGDVDLTNLVWTEFQTTGSPFSYPLVGSYTSDGLVDDWPKPGDDLGGGWSMSLDSFARLELEYPIWNDQRVWTDQSAPDVQQESLVGGASPSAYNIQYITTTVHGEWVDWTAVFTVMAVNQNFIIHYETARKRTEKLTFSLEADVQPILVDPEGSDVELIEVSSNFIDKPVDPGDLLPIEDVRRNCYFPTSRGTKSAEHLMLLARAKLRFRSRAVMMTFRVKGWIEGLNCRRNIVLVDGRLPGGQASGKIIAYKMNAKRSMTTDITIGCAIGNGIALPAAAGGDDAYADNYATGYTQREGAEVTLLSGELVYDPIDASVVDDDGVDFFNMNLSTVVESFTVTDGPNDQQHLLNIVCGQHGTAPDPIGALRDHPTQAALVLKPVDGGAFFTEYAITIQPLVIPKLIDLAAPSV